MSHLVEIVATDAPAGAEIRGVDLKRDVSGDVFAQIEAALHAHGVIFFRGPVLSPEEHMRFSVRFGELETPVLEQYTVPGYRQVAVLSNILEDGKPVGIVDAGNFWHSDSTYRPEPARCSLLHGIEVPTEDGRPLGDTLFVRTDRAFDKLDDAMRERLSTLKAIHSFSHPYTKFYDRPPEEGGGKRAPLTAEQKARTPDSIHPVIRTHPFTGRKCLYVNEGLTAGFVGMDSGEGEKLLEELCALCTPPEEIYRHRWQVGDLLIWDNCMTQHHATGGYTFPRHRRYMRRTTAKGSVPF